MVCHINAVLLDFPWFSPMRIYSYTQATHAVLVFSSILLFVNVLKINPPFHTNKRKIAKKSVKLLYNNVQNYNTHSI